MTGLDPQSGRSNYLVGRDRSRWRTKVPQFAKVRYEEVYPGIDLVYYGRQRQLEYDFVVQPKADPRRIELEFKGADRLEIDPRGDLIVDIGKNTVRQHKPVAYQERDGKRQAVQADYVVHGRRRVSFRIGAYDRSRTLIVDPALVYAKYFGGGGLAASWAIAVDGSGSAYVTGYTRSADFPTASPMQSTYAGGAYNGDAFVAKLNPSGTALLYSTYLGGSDDDVGSGIAVDGAGSAYVTGTAWSTDFPTASPLQSTNAGYGVDAFVAKLDPAGSALVYSTYLGGTGLDDSYVIAVDGSGSAAITGLTSSTDFPAARPLQTGNGGGWDAFVAMLNPAGTGLVYSTCLGGSEAERGWGIAADNAGNAYVAADQSLGAYTGNTDVFVAKISSLMRRRYRLFSDITKEHYYTTDLNEYTVLGQRGWVQEGIAHLAYINPTPVYGLTPVPLYRLYHEGIRQHLWTTDRNENDVLGAYGWTQEGIDGYILPAEVAGVTKPLYRLNYAYLPLHLWTTDLNEYTVLPSWGWIQEGVVGHVVP